MDEVRPIYSLSVYEKDDQIHVKQTHDFPNAHDQLTTIKFIKFELDSLLELDPEELPKSDGQ